MCIGKMIDGMSDVLDKRNIIPLLAEMKELFLHDEIAQSILGNNFNALFAKKNAKGEFEQRTLKIDSSKEVDDALPVLKRRINLILGELNRKDQYYKKLIATIKKISSFSCIIFLDIVCCLLSNVCAVTSFYQSLQAMSSFLLFSICATYCTLSSICLCIFYFSGVQVYPQRENGDFTSAFWYREKSPFG